MDPALECSPTEEIAWCAPEAESPGPGVDLHLHGGNNRASAHLQGTSGELSAPIGNHRALNARLDGDAGVDIGSGQWIDPNDGTVNRGVRARGGLHGRLSNDGMPGQNARSAVEVSALTFDAGAYTNQDVTGIGVTANGAEIAAEYGSRPDPDSNLDSSVRISGSVGVGAGVRLNHGDEDGDGVMEAGFGVDAGPLGLDVRTEVAGQMINDLPREPSRVDAFIDETYPMPEMPVLGTERRILAPGEGPATGLEGAIQARAAMRDRREARAQAEMADTPLMRRLAEMGARQPPPSTEYAEPWCD